MELAFLKSLVIILAISALVVFVLGRLRISSVVGFLTAGIILGPHGLQLIREVADVELFAEIGIILLLFTIGLEFSLKNLLTLRRAIFGGGFSQVLMTTMAVAFLSYLFLHHRINAAIFDGFLVSLSSTAIVMKILHDRGEIYTPHSRMSLGMLIFQDLCVVPLMLLVPILSGNGGGITALAYIIFKSSIVIGVVLFAANWGVPHILHQVVSMRSRDLFVITILLLCLSTALLTSLLGLSLALGAFLAGIVISESEYASQAISDMLPFKESFTGLFFISIGMLLDIGFLRTNLLTVVVMVLVILLIKIVTVTLSASALGQSLRGSIQTGFYLSQIGEFSFILAVAGKANGLITEETYQIFLSAAILTMIVTPFMISASPSLASWVISMPISRRLDRMRKGIEKNVHIRRTAHVIIAGFGMNGRNLAQVLRDSEIPYVILELNNSTVRKMKKRGEPIYYGDGTSREVLHKLGVDAAKVLVIAISDAASTRRIVRIARKESPDLHIIVRTRYVAEVDHLIDLGANEVIPEEFETSIEIFSRVLDHYNIPGNVITDHIHNIRSDCYSVLRGVALPQKALAERYELLKGIETETYLIKEGARVAGRTLKELNLRAETGVTIIAIKRGDNLHQNPPTDFVLKSGDILLLIGKKEDTDRALEYIESERQ
ncbi:MAG: cation:proton antiporter [Nitrospirae bacterium]|nr:cation:proton antiporter [Nitrospirota bacterium]